MGNIKIKMNFNHMKNYISVHDISFLVNFDRTIDINKSGKSDFYKMFRINQEHIKDFILNLFDNKIYMINPFISINCRINDPYINLSRQFLITNKSNHKIVHDYLFNQFEKA
jgi:hypothetical protein